MSKKEIFYVTINVLILKMLLIYPRFMVETAGNSAWMTMIILTAAAVVFSRIFHNFISGRKCITDIFSSSGGRAVSGIILTAALFINIITTVCFFPLSVKTVLLQYVDTKYIITIFIIVSVICAFPGIKALAKIHSIFLPVIFITVAVFFLLLIQSVEIKNLFPLFGTGYKNIFVYGLVYASFFNDLIIINVLGETCPSRENLKKAVSRGIIISGALSTAFLLVYCMIYPFPTSMLNTLPFYSLSKNMRLGSYFGRFEALFEFIITIMAILYTALYINIIARVFSKTFYPKAKNLVISITGIIIYITLLAINSQTLLLKISKKLYIASMIILLSLAVGYSVLQRKNSDKLVKQENTGGETN